jgi:hypothetical protein
MRRFCSRSLVLAISVLILAGTGGTVRAEAPRSTTLAVAPDGSDRGSCRPAKPCRTFAYAYRVARRGDVVDVAPGVYGKQSIEAQPARAAGADVIFRPRGKGRVTIGDLRVRGRHVEFRRFVIRGSLDVDASARDVTARGLTIRGGFFVWSARDVRLIGGSVGPGVDYKSMIWPENVETTVAPRNILIDGVLFHDWTRSSADRHVECLQVAAVDRLVIRNSRFVRCAVMAVSLYRHGNAGQPRRILIENNFFGTSIGGYYSLAFGGSEKNDWADVVVRNNSATQAMLFDNTAASYRNVRVLGNLAPNFPWLCERRIVYRRNVWKGARCGPTDLNSSLGFQDGARLDLRLRRGAPAIDRGDSSSFPRTDIFGRRRPAGRAPDAGAHEAR